MDCAADAIVSVRPDGVISFLNRAAVASLGYSPEELIGKATPRIFHEPEELARRQAEYACLYGERATEFGFSTSQPANVTRSEDEWTYVRKDGSRFPVQLAISRTVDKAGNLLGFMGIARDISEQKNAQQTLRENETLFRNIFAISPYAISISSMRNETFLEVNQAYLDLTGLKKEELVGHSIHKYNWFEAPEEMDLVRQIIQRQGYISNYRHRAIMPDGRLQHHLLSVYPVTWQEIPCAVGIVVDITPLVNAETKLGESEALFRDVFENSPYPMSIKNVTEGRILEVNQAYLQLTGLSRNDLVGQRVDKYDWFAVPEERMRIQELLTSQGFIREFSHSARMLDGRLRTHLLNIYPIRYHGEPCMASVVNDITEKVQAEERIRLLNAELENKVQHRTQELEQSLRELANSQEQLIQSERLAALGQLAAGVAHELNTPMGIIHSSAHESSDLLSKDLMSLAHRLAAMTTTDQEISFALAQNASASLFGISGTNNRQRRKELIQRLDLFSIAQSEAMADMLLDLGLEDTIVPPPPWLQSASAITVLECAHTLATLQRLSQIQIEASTKASRVLEALRSYLRQDDRCEKTIVSLHDEINMVLLLFHNRIKHGISVLFDVAESLHVLAKRDQLNQVWINIVNNALQAMPLEGTLAIRAYSQDSQRVLIEFTDSGHGIPPEIQNRIFEPFFTTKKKGEGIGLGLDICRHIIENHQGTIHVSSRPGHTTFTIDLPLYSQEAP